MPGLWSLINPQPDEIKNIIDNPSFEIGTTGWSVGGSNTIAQSSAQQWRGGYSGLVTYQDTTTLVSFALSGLTAGATYYAKLRLFVPSNWDGGDIDIQFDFTDDTPSVVAAYTDGSDPTGEWIELETSTVLGSDVAGNLQLVTDSAPTAGRTLYIDGLYFGLADVTYFDGDTDGCRWQGTRHASPSISARYNPQVGQVLNLRNDLGLHVQRSLGIGEAPADLQLSPNALLPGAKFEDERIRPRTMTLLSGFVGADVPGLHSKRKALGAILRRERGGKRLPVLWRYHGAHATRDVEILARYQSGLDMAAGRLGPTEQFPLVLTAPDPYWYGLGGSGGVLDGQAALSDVNRLIHRDQDGNWDNMDEGVSGTVHALAMHPNGSLVVVGTFTAVGSGAASASRVALWDPATGSWTGLTGGPDASNVYCVAIEPGTGDIYVGGDFTTLNGGGTTANGLAYWDISGSSWGVLTDSGAQTGVDATVRALAFDSLGNLYIAGQFANAGGTAAAKIAYWDGTDFNALGAGLSGGAAIARALFVDQVGRVWVGGDFTSFAGVSVVNIAYWKALAATPAAVDPGGGLSGGDVYQINQDSRSRRIYAVGEFTDKMASYTGKTWTPVNQTKVDYSGGTAIIYAAQQISGSGSGIEKQANLSGLGGYIFGGIFDRLAVPGDDAYQALPEGLVLVSALLQGDYYPFTVDLPGTPTVSALAYSPKSDDLFIGFNTSGSANTPNAETLTNNGTARAYPLIEMFGPTSGDPDILYALVNNTTGKAIYFDDYPLYASTSVLLDLRPGQRAFYDPGSKEEKGVNLWQFILPGSDLDWFLAPGDNYIDLNTEDSTMKAVVTWRETHGSVDGVAD